MKLKAFVIFYALFFLSFPASRGWSANAIQVQAKDKYLLARRAYLNGNWEEAKTLFSQTLSLLESLRGKTKRQKFLFLIGRSDVRFHLAKIAKKQKRVFASCFLFRKVTERVNMLPKGWQKWPINTRLPSRFSESEQQLKVCRRIPSVMAWTLTPKNAKVEILVVASISAGAKDRAPKGSQTSILPEKKVDTGSLVKKQTVSRPTKRIWKEVQSPLKLLSGKERFRISAPGYHTLEKFVNVPIWKRFRANFTLRKKKPKPRPRLRIVKPPITKKVKPTPPWVWAVVGSGVVVAAGAAVVLVLVFQPVKQVQVTVSPNLQP